MMQRKNKSRSSTNNNGGGYGSGYESNNDNNNNQSSTSLSSPSKPPPPAPASSGGGGLISIGALTGHTTTSTHTNKSTTTAHNNNNSHRNKQSTGGVISIATVKRNNWGTQPFDTHWLNLDCCGLICAGVTYMLHVYGVYSFGWILLPPWFSVMDEDGYRVLTFGCHLHRTLFTTIAFLAVFAHFKAMTTDPGAVPPDANPLPNIVEENNNLDELDNLIKGETSPTNSPRKTHHEHEQHGVPRGMNSMEMMERGVGGDSSTPNNISSRRGSSQSQSSNNNTLSSSSLLLLQASSSSLMQEDNCCEGNNNNRNNGNNMMNNNNNGRNNNNGNGLPQAATAVATAGAVGAAVVGAAGVAAAVAGGAALASLSAVAPIKAKDGGSESRSPMPPPPSQQQPRGRRMCRRCQAFKPPRAHHCSICKRCIIKMDHHCPWVNNCVGIGNHKYFLLFIFYTSLSCMYSFTFIIYRFFNCLGHSSHHRGPRCVDHPTDLLPLVGLTVEALLFGLFTLCMMVDQWDVVMTNLTHIDRLKGHDHHHHNHGGYATQQHAGAYGQLPQHYHQHVAGSGARNLVSTARAGINEVFGTTGRHMSPSTTSVLPTSRFHYTWLSPLHKACFPEHVRDDIFGYCRPITCGGASSAAASAAAAAIGKGMEMVGRGGGDKKGRGGIGGAEIV